MIEKLYTVEEVAELASVTGRTIRNYLKSGRLKGRKIGGQWRFPEAEVQRLLTGGDPETEDGPAPGTAQAGQGAPAQPAAPAQQEPADDGPYLSYDDEGYEDSYEEPAPPPEPTPAPAAGHYGEPLQAAAYQPAAGQGYYAEPAPLPGARPRPNQGMAPQPQPQQPYYADDGYGQPTEPMQTVNGYATYDQPAPQQPYGQPMAQPSVATPVYAQPQGVPGQGGPQRQPFGQPLAGVAPTQQPFEPVGMPGAGAPPAFAGQQQAPIPGTPLYAAPQPAAPEPVSQAFYPAVGPAPAAGPAAPGYEPAGGQPFGYAQQPSLPSAYPPSPSGGGYYAMQQQQHTIAGAANEPAEDNEKDEPEPKDDYYDEDEGPQVVFSDVGRKVSKFVAEVHDCSHGPQMCAVIDQNQSLSAAKQLSERLAVIAEEESEAEGLLCQAYVEFDDRFYVARFTLFGSTSFLERCLKLLG